MASPAGPAEPSVPADSAEAARRAPGRSLAGRLVVLVVAAAACALGARLGAWWVPFLVGVGAGLLKKARTSMLWPAVIGAILGWGLLLWIMALASLPVGATARTIAALGGLPSYAGVAVAVTLLLAALQVLVGAWLARAGICFCSRMAMFPSGPSDSSEDPPDVRIGQV
jgi:hypothetical protein